MLIFTEEIGQPVFDSRGERLGRAVELVVDVADPAGWIIRLGVGGLGFGPGRRLRGWVEWSDVASFETSSVQLVAGANMSAVGEVGHRDTELWLSRDVLDTQIVDPSGGRLVRVGDIALIRVEQRLRIVAVEFGTGPVARRLGLRRLGHRLPTASIDWQELHLASARGLNAQLSTDSPQLNAMSARELAMMVAQIPTDRGSVVLDAVGADRAAKALSLAHPDVSSRLVHSLPHDFASKVLTHMPADDATETLRGMPPDRVAAILDKVDTLRARELRALLAHPAHTAGGLMSCDVRTAMASDSLDNIRMRLRADPPPTGRFGGVVVVDPQRRPIAMIDPIDLIVESTSPTRLTVIPSTTPIDEVIDRFATSDHDSVAVVDPDGRLLGVITSDDVLEELVAERLPGRRRFHHFIDRHRTERDRTRNR